MKILDAHLIYFVLGLAVLLLTVSSKFAQAQETDYRRTSVKAATGIGINAGQEETGIGMIYSVGLQRSYGENRRLRLNPNILIGSFRTYAFPTDTRDQLYKLTTIEFNVHYDLIRKETGSFVVSCGGFMDYSRGLLGTGGMPEENNSSSEYFHSLYFGGTFSLGIRIEPEKSKLAYEIRPFNLYFGNRGFILGFIMFGVDFRFKKQ